MKYRQDRQTEECSNRRLGLVLWALGGETMALQKPNVFLTELSREADGCIQRVITYRQTRGQGYYTHLNKEAGFANLGSQGTASVGEQSSSHKHQKGIKYSAHSPHMLTNLALGLPGKTLPSSLPEAMGPLVWPCLPTTHPLRTSLIQVSHSSLH